MDKRKKAGIILSVILGIGGLLYFGGILGQVLANYQAWLGGNGISGDDETARLEFTGLHPTHLHAKWSEGNGYRHTSWCSGCPVY